MRDSAATGRSSSMRPTVSASVSHSIKNASAGARERKAKSRHAAALASTADSLSSGARSSALNLANGIRPLAADNSSSAARTGA